MVDNLIVASFTTFTTEKVGIVINDKIIPVGSLGHIYCIGAKVQITWVCPPNNEKKIVILSEEDFWYLVKNKFIVDIEEIKKPESEPKFKVGDFVSFMGSDAYIVDRSKYDFESKEWIYLLFRIGDDFKLEHFDYYCDEYDLVKIDKFATDLDFEDRKYKVMIEEIEK